MTLLEKLFDKVAAFAVDKGLSLLQIIQVIDYILSSVEIIEDVVNPGLIESHVRDLEAISHIIKLLRSGQEFTNLESKVYNASLSTVAQELPRFMKYREARASLYENNKLIHEAAEEFKELFLSF